MQMKLGLVMVLLGGCVPGSVQAAPKDEKPPPCPDWGCGTNAASMGDRLKFHQINICGKPPDGRGVWLESFEAKGVPLTPHVQGDKLIGVDSAFAPVEGKALEGAVMVLASGLERFEVRVKTVDATPFWVGPAGTAPTYVFEWRQKGAGVEAYAPLCAGKAGVSPEWASKIPGATTQLALVFLGDVYDAKAKTVTIQPTECLVNVACAGSAIAKMHLLRHTTAGSLPPNFTTDVDQRQTLLKMLTDDICGTGRSFTVDGEDVHYTYADGHKPPWHPLPGKHKTVEAIWDRNGAVCLDEARRAAEDPSVPALIQQECSVAGRRLKGCSAWPTADPKDYGYSVNP